MSMHGKQLALPEALRVRCYSSLDHQVPASLRNSTGQHEVQKQDTL